MKKFLVLAALAVGCGATFIGCNKNGGYVTTTNPSMTADIGNFKFISSAVRTATFKPQLPDTLNGLIITGYTSDNVNPYDKVVLYIRNYKRAAGTFSIVQGQANAIYYHNGLIDSALGGVIAISEVTSTTTSGYFKFNTKYGSTVTNGNYVANNP